MGIKLAIDASDMSLVSDERNFNEEVIFSPYLIAQTYGNRLPFSFDTNDTNSVQSLFLSYKQYDFNNVFVSTNYYNPDNVDLSCLTANTSCDIGLTGIDNGLVTGMTAQTITFTNGINDFTKFDRLSFDRRLKMFQVTGYTSSNIRFSGFDKTILYEVVSKYDSSGYYHELYGGFYQGFYKLFGYDYDIFPERMNKGWTVEMLLRPRLFNEYGPSSGETTLNTIYPENKNIFFYMGTRAENKFYHHADGFMGGISAYTRVTSDLTKLETCSCCNTGVTNSRCIYVYPPRSNNGEHDPHKNYGCDVCGCNSSSYVCSSCGCPTFVNDTCGWECKSHSCESSVQSTCETDPLFDSISNAISFKLCGDINNPSIGVKVLRFTGDCVTTGSCETSGITYQTGFTITEYCSPTGIYDYCENVNASYLELEHWFQIDVVWERYTWLDTCNLWYRGGLGDITERKYLESLANNTMVLIAPPYTQIGYPPPGEVELVDLNEKWLLDKEYRNGRLKIYVNGRRFFTIENFEEIIPRGLNTDKEKQVGVPFNISWGGGTQGLRENLTFSSTTGTTYIQDPESLPTNDLVGTDYSGLTTNILLEQNFGGTFEGGISQFRMYITPLSAPEVKHNFNLLKDTFDMFNPDCPDCGENFCPTNDFTFTINGPSPTPSITPTQTPTNTVTPTQTPTNTVTPTQTPTNTVTPTQTPTNTITPTQTPTNTITPTQTSTNTPTPTSTPPPPFISVWRIDNGDPRVTLPYEIDGSYEGYIDWGDGTITSNSYGNREHSYTTGILPPAGDYTIRIYGVVDGFSFNNEGDKLKLIDITQWGTNFSFGNNGGYFYGCSNLILSGDPGNPNFTIGSVETTNLSNMFRDCTSLDVGSTLNIWNVSNISDMSNMFMGSSFSGDLRIWNMSSVINMSGMFANTPFNSSFATQTSVDFSNVSDMSGMFSGATSYNQNIGNWNVLGVINMSNMFAGATSFNQNIGSWDVSTVSDMPGMFSGATSFNQGISGWTVSSVVDMSNMFNGATSFNQDIGGWTVSSVNNMSGMFNSSTLFNQDINGWRVGNVTDMSNMFNGATSFNQDIGRWDVSSVNNFTNFMSSKTPLTFSSSNLDLIYENWSTLSVQENINISFGSANYSSSAAADGKSELETLSNWTIIDGGRV